MIGKNIKRKAQLSLVLLILGVMLVMPLGEPIIHGMSAGFGATETTDVDSDPDILDSFLETMAALTHDKTESHMPQKDTESGFNLPEVDGSYFTENLGQWGDHIRFLTRTSFGYTALSHDGVFYYVIQKDRSLVIKVAFQDATQLSPIGQNDWGFASNFFLGNDHSIWATDARSFKEVLYMDVWPGIDILYYFKDQQLKYDIIVGEYSDPSAISFAIHGNDDLAIRDNTLKISLSEQVSISDTELVAFYSDGSFVPIQFRRSFRSMEAYQHR